MTTNDIEKYAKAVEEYEYKKNRLYLFPHDDRTIKGLFKAIPLFGESIKSGLLFVVIYVAILGVLSGTFWLADGTYDLESYIRIFKGICGFFIIVPLVCVTPYFYLFYMNYIHKDTGGYACAFGSFLLWALLYEIVESTSALIGIYLVSAILLTKLYKMSAFEKCVPKPQQSDFDSEKKEAVS